MATIINQQLHNFLFDISANPYILGRLKLPYKSFNFLAILSRGVGMDRYDRATEIIELCHWLFNQVSDIRNIINRLAEYAITDIQIDDTNTRLNKDQQETLSATLEVIGLKKKLVEIAKNFFATGNAFVSIEVRFKKHLKCPKCNTSVSIDNIPFTFDKKTIQFKAKCLNNRNCNYEGAMIAYDIKKRRPEDIDIKVWDWHDIEFTYNPISNEYKYYYKLPKHFTEKLTKGTPDSFLIGSTPQEILKEIFTNKRNTVFTNPSKSKIVGFRPNKLRHLKQPSTISSVMEGWGEPITVGVLQDAFFMLLLRQAQAVLLTDYIIPIRVVSPDPKVAEFMDITQFAAKFDQVYDSFVRDPMQIMKVPFPINYQTLTGEAKNLFLSNEMDYTRQSIRRGMGVPAELLDGGLQNQSAGNISLRMLENYFINFLNSTVVDLINNFLVPQICLILGMPPFKTNMAKFKMIDDVQQKQAMLELFDRKLIPDTTVYEHYNVDRPSTSELLKSVEEMARRDGTYQKILANYQAEGQSRIAERQAMDQIKMQEMQQKEQITQQAKDNPNGDVAGQQAQQNQTEGNPQQVLTPKGEALPPPEELGDYMLSQLTSPEEINNAIAQLQGQIPGNENYIKKLQSHIEQGQQNQQNQQQAQAQMQDVQSQDGNPAAQNPAAQNPASNGGGGQTSNSDKIKKNLKRPLPEQKGQRRTNPV